MKFTPRKTTFLISQLILALTAVFSAINLIFIYSGTQKIMPLALSMTGFLAKGGNSISLSSGLSFFSIYSLVLAGIVCAVLLLSSLLSITKRVWLGVSTAIVLADSIGIALVILNSGYRSGYWFEIAGHAVMAAALIVSFLTMPGSKQSAGKANDQ